MAESISEGTLKTWLKQVGDSVAQDEEVATIETDKVCTSLLPQTTSCAARYTTSTWRHNPYPPLSSRGSSFVDTVCSGLPGAHIPASPDMCQSLGGEDGWLDFLEAFL